ncbi:AIPR family protein [Achromobacter xylosoxidans]|uniref:AIPR family protein n=1 Tax=Alcaligenes xylosoxydans xylosoxydans TaxID=85698 RepID=UPI0006C5EA99|nr:AIPR family protein [Achromobacter xylosoxidans]CUJ34014.1 AIPR protein [Achromobacter xylosoxidans]
MSYTNQIGFEDFRRSWLEDVQAGNPSTVELGRRFALKLVTQWLDTSETNAEFIYCDGSGDGGIDVALLDTGPEELADDAAISGHTWYLVQSKYGAAFAGSSTLLAEGQKVVDTLDDKRPRLNSLAEGVLERLNNFKKGAGSADRIVLVFATEHNLNEAEKRVLADIRAIGTARLGPIFDVETISIETIHARLQEVETAISAKRLTINLPAHVTPSGPDLLVGSVGLQVLYEFLKRYRDQTGDLDRIYEKNVRRFLGGRGKVNKAMQATLRDAPERFGLYNNGITIVVHDYEHGQDKVTLSEPYIVNGCQTTRTIWEVFHNRLSAGGTGVNPETDAWKLKASHGAVVTKIVKVGGNGEALLQAITRYTNSQNAIREKDFLALTGDFKAWQSELADRYDLYLEIQRGGWDSQKALQNTNPNAKQFQKQANAADLIKVYGAGWLGDAGLAFGKNPPFLPDGSVFKRIVNGPDSDGGPFGVVDLYAAYLLQQATAAMGFGRGAAKQSRRQTRFLFLMIVLDLFRDVLSRADRPTDPRSVSAALVAVLGDNDARNALLETAAEVIDGYLTQGSDDSVFTEPAYLNSFNTDLNAFLKWEKLGKSDSDTPRLKSALAVNKAVMGKMIGGISARQVIINAIDRA